MEHLGSVAMASVSGVAWTTVIAAAIAALVGVANLWASLLSSSRQRAIDRRAQWWTRFTWAAEMSVSGGTGLEADLGLKVLDALIGTASAESRDTELALAIAQVVVDTRSEFEQSQGGESDGHAEVPAEHDRTGEEA